MKDSRRRNKNIGTAKQGHRRQSQFVIPESYHDLKCFWEKLIEYKVVSTTINSNEYKIIVEKTLKNYCHACTIDDLTKLLSYLNPRDLEGLSFIILRQPKKKENILSPVWGRLIYSFEFESQYGPALIIEAVDYSAKLIKNRKLSVERKKEFDRLVKDGHSFKSDKRSFIADYVLENVRNTQLFRSFLHEIGHYVQYRQYTEKPYADIKSRIDALDGLIDWDSDGEDKHFDEWNKLTEQYSSMQDSGWKKYDAIISREKRILPIDMQERHFQSYIKKSYCHFTEYSIQRKL